MSTRPRIVKAPDARQAEIVAAARRLFATQGVRATTVLHVADAVGVTRGLVYHYAGTMDGLVDLVLDSCVADFVTDLRDWDAHRRPGDIDHAVAEYVALLRRHLPHRIDADDEIPSDLPRFDDASLYVRYIDRSVEAMLDVLEQTTIPAYAARHRIEITPVRETFALLLHGIVGLLRTQPQISSEVLGALVRQTLRLAPTQDGIGAVH